MSRVFITGSSDGLGRMAGEVLFRSGHEVVLHARNQRRADETRKSAPKAKSIVIGDLSTIEQTRNVAEQVNALGEFDAVIHNAGVGYQSRHRIETEDGLTRLISHTSVVDH